MLLRTSANRQAFPLRAQRPILSGAEAAGRDGLEPMRIICSAPSNIFSAYVAIPDVEGTGCEQHSLTSSLTLTRCQKPGTPSEVVMQGFGRRSVLAFFK